MEKILFHLTDDEIKHTYLLIPKGKEKLFTRKEDFTIVFGQEKFTAYLYYKEIKQLGGSMKGGQYIIDFRDQKPSFFVYRKKLVLSSGDGNEWIAELVEE